MYIFHLDFQFLQKNIFLLKTYFFQFLNQIKNWNSSYQKTRIFSINN